MTVHVHLTQGFIALVDNRDRDLAALNWYAIQMGRNWYAWRGGDTRTRNGKSHMHRVVLERKLGRPLRPGEVTDHINRDGLDNRRSNLRAVSQFKNTHNHRLSGKNTSGHSGVSLHKATGRWAAYIWIRFRKVHLGYFADLPDAVAARERAEGILP